MAATVTNDELSAQARLIWRASFLSSLLRPVSFLPHAKQSLRYIPSWVSVSFHPLVLHSTFSSWCFYTTVPCLLPLELPLVQPSWLNTGQTRYTQAVPPSSDINDRGIFHGDCPLAIIDIRS